jgi:hypothetical protein
MTPIEHAATLVLYADINVLEALGRAFREGPTGRSLEWFALGAVLVIATIAVIFRVAARKPRNSAETETDVFAALLDLLDLAAAERADLQFMAAHRLDGCAPSAALLTPRNFAIAAEKACIDDRDDVRLSRLAELCLKIFDERMPTGAALPRIKS